MPSQLERFRQRRGQKQVAAPMWFDLGGKRLEDHFEMKEQVGHGSFARVHRCVCKETGADMAVKIIEKNNIDVKAESLRSEVRILGNIKHDNVLSLKHVFEDEKHVYMVMDLMHGGELFEKICNDFPDGYSEAKCSQIIAKVIGAVAYLHSKGIMHRDLKPENLLFVEGSDDTTDVRIADFGLAKIWSGDMLVKTACGSPNYVAPEVLLNEQHGYTFAVDMWSVGVILYVMLCGFCPFYEDSTPALFKSITTGNYTFPSPYWDTISEEAKSMVRGLLCVDVFDRLTPANALAHPFITRYNGVGGDGASASGEEAAVIPRITQNMRRFKKTRNAIQFHSDDETETSSEESD